MYTPVDNAGKNYTIAKYDGPTGRIHTKMERKGFYLYKYINTENYPPIRNYSKFIQEHIPLTDNCEYLWLVKKEGTYGFAESSGIKWLYIFCKSMEEEDNEPLISDDIDMEID